MVLFRDCIPYSHIHVLSVLSEVLFYLAAQWLCFVITSLLVHLLSVPSEVSFHLAAGRAVAVICLSRCLISFYPLRSIGGIFLSSAAHSQWLLFMSSPVEVLFRPSLNSLIFAVSWQIQFVLAITVVVGVIYYSCGYVFGHLLAPVSFLLSGNHRHGWLTSGLISYVGISIFLV